MTGGGFIDNIPRVLPAGCVAHIEPGSWPIPPVFTYIQSKGQVPVREMYRTFNMGIGMVAIVSAKDVEDIMQQLSAHGETPYLIGEIRSSQPSEADRQIVITGVC